MLFFIMVFVRMLSDEIVEWMKHIVLISLLDVNFLEIRF